MARDERLTEVQAAALIGISSPTLNILRRRGNGPPFHDSKIPGVVGNHVGHYRKSEVLLWAKSRRWGPLATRLTIKNVKRKARKTS